MKKNFNSNYYYKFPCYLHKLFIINENGKRNVFTFTNRAKLYCCRNPQRDLIIVAKGIGNWINDRGLDNLTRIEYIRNEKKWIKYNKLYFVHFQKGTEKVKIETPDMIRIRGKHRLWGFQKIQDEEVK